MTDDMIELAKRAVACKGWGWRCGMLISDGAWFSRVGSGYNWKSDAELLPDLADPATLGCLLALVREAWGDPYLCAVGDPDTGWRIDAVTAQVQDLHGYASEAEALVFALEGAP